MKNNSVLSQSIEVSCHPQHSTAAVCAVVVQKNSHRAFAMIEVLISMGIISLVLLSLLIYQITMFKDSEQTNFKAIAFSQLMSFSEILLTDKTNSYRNETLTIWNADNHHWLPHGAGGFVENGNHQCKITVRWFFKKMHSASIGVFC